MAPGPDTKALVSYLPDADWLPDWMQVEQLVGMFTDFYADFDPAKAFEMLDALHIARTAKLRTLSKGNKEKVQLILAMSRAARLYLLDEPIGGVDPAARDYILHTIISNYSKDATVILSTHLIGDIEPVLDEVRPPQCRRAARDRGHERGCIFPGGIQMLSKLLKYEFKATCRIYGGLYLAILAAAALLGAFFRFPALVSEFPIVVVTTVYLMLCVAIAVITALTIIQRFTRNLLGREGYLMHTLPVTPAQLILSKLISSMVWLLCSILVIALSRYSAARSECQRLYAAAHGHRVAGHAGLLHPVPVHRLHDRASVQAAFCAGGHRGLCDPEHCAEPPCGSAALHQQHRRAGYGSHRFR